MVAITNNSKANQHSRSVSFPPKTNPMIQKIEKQLKDLKEREESSTSEIETMCIGLSGLAGLYQCVNDSLLLPLTQQTLTQVPLDHWVDASSKLLQICSTSQQMLVTLRKAVRNLLGSSISNDSIQSYFSARKEIIRSTKELVVSLKQLEGEAEASLGVVEQKEAAEEVTRALTCVTIITMSVVESLLKLLMSKPKYSSAKQGLLSKLGLTRKASGKATVLPCKNGNKLTDVDNALHVVSVTATDAEDIQIIAQKRLENFEGALTDLEEGVSLIFSMLTKTKASLLNILSV